MAELLAAGKPASALRVSRACPSLVARVGRRRAETPPPTCASGRHGRTTVRALLGDSGAPGVGNEVRDDSSST